MNVVGGSSGDGVRAKLFHQFYGRLKERSLLKALDGEAHMTKEEPHKRD